MKVDSDLLTDGFYIIEFPTASQSVQRVIALRERGEWFTLGKSAGKDGLIPIAVSRYRVIRKIDLWD